MTIKAEVMAWSDSPEQKPNGKHSDQKPTVAQSPKFDMEDGWEDLKKKLAASVAGIENEEEAPAVRTLKTIVDGMRFQSFIGFCILLNAMFIGLETELCTKDACVAQTWTLAAWVFTAVWVTEAIAKLCAHKLRYFLDGWNLVDFFLMWLAVVDSVILPLVQPDAQNVRLISVLRLVRLFRLVRLVRFMKMFRELYLLINGFIDAIKVLSWIFVLLFVILYCSGIFCTNIIGESCDEYALIDDPILINWRCDAMFGNIRKSMYTLFQVLCEAGSHDSVIRPVMTLYPQMLFFFTAYLFFTTFGLLNVIVGVIVENTLNAAQQNEETQAKRRDAHFNMEVENLRRLFAEADVNENGTMDRDEMHVVVNDKSARLVLEELHIPTDNPDELFNIFDVDGSGELDIEEFITGIMRLKGSASAKDMLSCVLTSKAILRSVQTTQKQTEELGAQMSAQMKAMDERLMGLEQRRGTSYGGLPASSTPTAKESPSAKQGSASKSNSDPALGPPPPPSASAQRRQRSLSRKALQRVAPEDPDGDDPFLR